MNSTRSLKSVFLIAAFIALFASATAGHAAPGDITTVAGNGTIGYSGDGGPAASASLAHPVGVAVDSLGNIYTSDPTTYRVRKVGTDGVITTVAGNGANGYSGDGGQASAASLARPVGVAVDATGNIYIADAANHRIRRVDTGGVISTIAGYGGTDADYDPGGFSGDGGQAISARLAHPAGVAVDSAGNIYIADTDNNRIRKIGTDGVITTVAGDGSWLVFAGDGGPASSATVAAPIAVTVDSIGNIYVADYTARIRKVGTNGVITTVAGNGTVGYSYDGGQASSARLGSPSGMAVDAIGNIYIVDYGFNRIRKVGTDGVITTVAGNGTLAYAGDGGPATLASLYYPRGVAIDAAGNLYIGDYGNSRIRKVQGMPAVTLNLAAGWNLAGNSSLSALDVATAFGDAGKVASVWKWIASSAKWAFYSPALAGQPLIDYTAGKGYEVLTTVNGGEGVWINAKTPFTAQLPAGVAVTTGSLQIPGMAPGWNLIDVADNKTPSEFNAITVASSLTTLWAWDAVKTNWYFYSPAFDAQGGTVLADYITGKGYLDFTANGKTLAPGVGFWVNKP